MQKSRSISNNKTFLTARQQCPEPHSKIYKCDCCRSKKIIDYNHQRRIKKQQNIKKTTSISTKSLNKQNKLSLLNIPLIKTIISQQQRAISQLDLNKDFKHKQSPCLTQRVIEKPSQSPIDCKIFCQNLFSAQNQNNKSNEKHKIMIKFKDVHYFTQFQNVQKMKIALGELKLIIKDMHKQNW